MRTGALLLGTLTAGGGHSSVLPLGAPNGFRRAASAFYMRSFVLLLPLAAGFYLPGVAVREYQADEKVDIKVNKLTSTKTQLVRALLQCRCRSLLNNQSSAALLSPLRCVLCRLRRNI